jgi:hypothetical protein
MFEDTPRRSFDTPDAPAVDHVVIYDHSGDHPFRAVQFYEREVWEDGTRWLDELDRYTTSEEYHTAIKENTHIPHEDIRTDALPLEVAEI